MNVLHLNSGTETGGGMYHILALLDELKSWTNVTLGVFHDGELAKAARKRGIDVHLFQQRSRCDFSVVKKIERWLAENKIDIIHTHGARANFIVSFLKRRANSLWFVTVHSQPEHDFLHRSITGKIFTYLNVRAIKAADHVVAISERFQQQLVQIGVDRKKIHVIYNGIDFSVQPQAIYKREAFGLSDENFVIMMIARLEPVKAHETALLALKMLRNKHPVGGKHMHLVLVGDGSRKKELEQFAKNNGLADCTTFLGQREDINELLTICDITILTSKSESFPLVLLESARAKKPVITTDVGGVRKLVPGREFGYIIKIGDFEELAEKIWKMYELKNTGQLQKMGERFFQYASQHFSVEKFAHSVFEIYEAVLKKRSPLSGEYTEV